MTHLWVRAESRANEQRVGLMPDGLARLRAAGHEVSVETSATRAVPIERYAEAGARIVPEGSWREAPREAVIFGLKELPEDDAPLIHRHVMFGHAFKGQSAGRRLLARFDAGGGTLYDLEYLVDDAGRRVAAFGYWAGYAGAAVTLLAWAAQVRGRDCPALSPWSGAAAMLWDVRQALLEADAGRPDAIIVGALGRVGRGAGDFCEAMGTPVTAWDMAETARGAPFPEILDHTLFFNAILATPGAPVLTPATTPGAPRRLRVIGDIACDPDSDFNPVPLYHRATDWQRPVIRVAEDPPLDVMAIDNLPSLLPLESSEDFARQLLPHLLASDEMGAGVWARAQETFEAHRPKGET